MNDNNEKKKPVDSLKNAAKKISEKTASITGNLSSYITKKKLEKYLPIFESDIDRESFRHERVIRVVNYDSRLDIEPCKGSIGFYEKSADRKIPTFYTKYVENFDLTFFPHLSESVFIADPCIEGRYIEIDEYFSYMKQVRVNELTLIAQSLGAKHIDIKLRTVNKKSSSKHFGISASVPEVEVLTEGNASKTQTSSSKETVDIWASTDFKAGFRNANPVIPVVIYFKNESDIQSLIKMVLENNNKLKKRTYCLKASSSSGISLNEAASIGASLNGIKIKAGAAFENAAKTENEAILEYTIEF